MQLPKPPLSVDGEARRYIETLVRQLEQELTLRPSRQPTDGVLYLTTDVPVVLISPNGTLYKLAVDDAGTLTTTQVDL